MRAGDLAGVEALGNRIHAALPESPAVFAERLALFPAGALVAEHRGALAAYTLAHPWTLSAPPPLDVLLQRLPARPDCLYLHDIVVEPVRRQLGLAAAIIGWMPVLAQAAGLAWIELVAVLGTHNFWRGHGFAAVEDAMLAPYLAKYGAAAALMRRAV